MVSILIPWVIAATLLVFLAVYWLYRLEQRLVDLERRCEPAINLVDAATDTDVEALAAMVHQLKDHEGRLDAIEPVARRLAQALPHVIQGVGIVRYNAFEGVGGDQSFSLALIDRNGDGAVVSGLATGDDTRVYAKPLVNWKTTYGLSADEQRALGEARQRMERVPGNGATP